MVCRCFLCCRLPQALTSDLDQILDVAARLHFFLMHIKKVVIKHNSSVMGRSAVVSFPDEEPVVGEYPESDPVATLEHREWLVRRKAIDAAKARVCPVAYASSCYAFDLTCCH
jgi:hypothetical protein